MSNLHPTNILFTKTETENSTKLSASMAEKTYYCYLILFRDKTAGSQFFGVNFITDTPIINEKDVMRANNFVMDNLSAVEQDRAVFVDLKLVLTARCNSLNEFKMVVMGS